MKPMKNRIIRSIANDSQLGWVDLRRETWTSLAPPVPPVNTTIMTAARTARCGPVESERLCPKAHYF